MSPYSSKVVYDPVPPYDTEDIEAGGRAPDLPADDAGGQVDIQLQSSPTPNEADPDRQRAGRITQRECCTYAFWYFFCSLVALVLIIWIIAFYSYKGAKLRYDGH